MFTHDMHCYCASVSWWWTKKPLWWCIWIASIGNCLGPTKGLLLTVVNSCNNLPADIVLAGTLNSFKNLHINIGNRQYLAQDSRWKNKPGHYNLHAAFLKRTMLTIICTKIWLSRQRPKSLWQFTVWVWYNKAGAECKQVLAKLYDWNKCVFIVFAEMQQWHALVLVLSLSMAFWLRWQRHVTLFITRMPNFWPQRWLTVTTSTMDVKLTVTTSTMQWCSAPFGTLCHL